MSKLTVLFYIILLVILGTTGANSQSLPLIIFDTDMGPDYDDVGALAMLHTLASREECTILATVASDGHPSVAPTIEAINRYFGKPEIPVGIPSDRAPDFTAKNGWNDSLLHRFDPELRNKTNYPSAVDVYRQVLAEAEDHSITIVTVGFTTNLADLLDSSPDDYSNLSGIDLVRQKVRRYVAMAGMFPQGKEFNVFTDSESSYKVFTRWPTPILFSGFEIGVQIKTGAKTAALPADENPVQWAYEYNLRTYAGQPEPNRSSWDQTAVLVAVRNPSEYFYINGPGKFIIHQDGHNEWDPDVDAHHYFLSHKYPYARIENLIENLMMGRDDEGKDDSGSSPE